MEIYLDHKQQDTGDPWVLPSLGQEEHKPQPQKNAGESSVCASLQTVGAGKGVCVLPAAFFPGLSPSWLCCLRWFRLTCSGEQSPEKGMR